MLPTLTDRAEEVLVSGPLVSNAPRDIATDINQLCASAQQHVLRCGTLTKCKVTELIQGKRE